MERSFSLSAVQKGADSMAYEQDYIMRMIKEMVRALMSVLFKKRFHELSRLFRDFINCSH